MVASTFATSRSAPITSAVINLQPSTADRRAVRRTRTQLRRFHRPHRIIAIRKWNWCQTDQLAIAGCLRVSASAIGCPCSREFLQRIINCVAYIEAFAVAAHVTILKPVRISLHLIYRIEAFAQHETGSQAQHHRRVIRPLPWL